MTEILGIEYLREIGARLRAVIPQLRFSATVREPLEVGASGDKTFQIDRVAEDTVVSALKELRRPLTIVSEEMGMLDIDGGGDRVLIDPIDGSKNAVSGLPMFCTSIAVAAGETVKEIYLSYIINLLSGDEFWAEKGRGAYWNGQRLRAQTDDKVRVVIYETQNPGRDIPKILPLLSLSNRTRCFGSTALDLAFVSSGAVSIYANPSPSRSFDFAGGLLLVREAGGIITDTRGEDIDGVELSIKKSTPLLVSGNEMLHEKALETLSKSQKDRNG
ncbi:MAG: inositol monophosphatase family protein [Nitrospirota bacterium]|nr:inositol monophosphatase family protein [Nitrospirota bacterium]